MLCGGGTLLKKGLLPHTPKNSYFVSVSCRKSPGLKQDSQTEIAQNFYCKKQNLFASRRNREALTSKQL